MDGDDEREQPVDEDEYAEVEFAKEESDESDRIDKNYLCDQNDSARIDASNGKFKKIVD